VGSPCCPTDAADKQCLLIQHRPEAPSSLNVAQPWQQQLFSNPLIVHEAGQSLCSRHGGSNHQDKSMGAINDHLATAALAHAQWPVGLDFCSGQGTSIMSGSCAAMVEDVCCCSVHRRLSFASAGWSLAVDVIL
jgi:hypothetical protein